MKWRAPTIKGPVEIRSKCTNPMFVGACDEFPTLNLLRRNPINLKFLMFETETTQEEYNSPKRVLSLMDYVSSKSFPQMTVRSMLLVVTPLQRSSKRVHARSSLLWRKDPEGMDPHDKVLLQANFEDNPEKQLISKFETCEEVFNKYPDLPA